ncbi:hypothetical protein BGLA2_990109 [Burkholderia gladioli]|nr:hypothetical protein BGLA2_990109 [Burkholderia gladioli]
MCLVRIAGLGRGSRAPARYEKAAFMRRLRARFGAILSVAWCLTESREEVRIWSGRWESNPRHQLGKLR